MTVQIAFGWNMLEPHSVAASHILHRDLSIIPVLIVLYMSAFHQPLVVLILEAVCRDLLLSK